MTGGLGLYPPVFSENGRSCDENGRYAPWLRRLNAEPVYHTGPSFIRLAPRLTGLLHAGRAGGGYAGLRPVSQVRREWRFFFPNSFLHSTHRAFARRKHRPVFPRSKAMQGEVQGETKGGAALVCCSAFWPTPYVALRGFSSRERPFSGKMGGYSPRPLAILRAA